MSKRVDAAYLQDIVDAAEYIETYLTDAPRLLNLVRQWQREARGER